MGRFVFENTVRMEFDDRLLAHLEQVVTSKLRRQESFVFSWKDDLSVGGGRTTIWLHPHANIVFKFHGGRAADLNPAWLQALAYTAAGAHGLYIVPEPDAAAAARAHPSREPMMFRLAPDESGPFPES
jgi:hypothetical protein